MHMHACSLDILRTCICYVCRDEFDIYILDASVKLQLFTDLQDVKFSIIKLY